MKANFNRALLSVSIASLLSKTIAFPVYHLLIGVILIWVLWGVVTRPIIYRKSLYYFSPFLLLGFFYSVSWLLTGGDALPFLKLICGVCITFLVCIYFYSVGRSELESPNFKSVFLFSSFVLLVTVLFAQTKGENRVLNGNFVGMVAVLVYLAYLLTRLKGFLIHLLLFLILSYICIMNDAKSAILALFIGWLVNYVWKYVIDIPRFVFFLILSIIFFVIGAYVYLTAMGVIHMILAPINMQDTAAEFLYSGREDLWHILFLSIYDSYWFGLGVGSQKVLLLGLANSAHNLFLQVLIQGGVGALFAVVLFFFQTMWLLYKQGSGSNTSAAIASTIFILSVFEVFLTENNLVMGLILMSLLSLSIGISHRRTRNQLSL